MTSSKPTKLEVSEEYCKIAEKRVKQLSLLPLAENLKEVRHSSQE